MRLLEIALVAILAIYLFSLFIRKPNRPTVLKWIPVAAILVTALHIILEGIRWQMYIAYVFTAIIVLNAFSQKIFNHSANPAKQSRRFFPILMGVFGIILLGVGPIAPERVYEIYNSYLLAFFDEHVKGKEQPILAEESPFEEVSFMYYD